MTTFAFTPLSGSTGSSPLPVNAAQETGGNLQAISSSLGLISSSLNVLNPISSSLSSISSSLNVLNPISSSLSSISSSLQTFISAFGITGSNTQTNAIQIGGYASNPTIGAPLATTTGSLKQIWTGLFGETITRIIGPDQKDLFPAAAAPSDGVSNTENSPSIRSRLVGYNGTTWDRVKAGITTVSTNVTGVLNVLPAAVYHSGNITRTENQYGAIESDAVGNIKTTLATYIAGENTSENVLFISPLAMPSATGAWSKYASAAKVGTSGVSVKTALGRVRSAAATNANTTTVFYLLLVDKATAPVNNDLPFHAIVLPANTAASVNSSGQFDFGESGITVTNGVAYAISTTSEKVTLAATSDCMVYIRYI